jgi:hypothetical protein
VPGVYRDPENPSVFTYQSSNDYEDRRRRAMDDAARQGFGPLRSPAPVTFHFNVDPTRAIDAQGAPPESAVDPDLQELQQLIDRIHANQPGPLDALLPSPPDPAVTAALLLLQSSPPDVTSIHWEPIPPSGP